MSDQSSLPAHAPAAVLQELPPSAKLVAITLEHEGECTQSELVESTLLPARTVRSALSQLEENGLVASRFSFRDARQRIYSLESNPG